MADIRKGFSCLGTASSDRFALVGGDYYLLIIGQKAEAHQVANGVVDRANGIIKAMQDSYSQGNNFLMVPVSDISITARTEDGRPYCQINLRILANKEG